MRAELSNCNVQFAYVNRQSNEVADGLSRNQMYMVNRPLLCHLPRELCDLLNNDASFASVIFSELTSIDDKK